MLVSRFASLLSSSLAAAPRRWSSRGGLSGTAASASPLASRERGAEGRWATERDAALTAAARSAAAAPAPAIRRVGVVGLGLMGHGIAQSAASAGCDVVGDPLGDLGPPGQLPELKRALAPAESPAHRQIKFACTRGDIAQMNRGIVKAVAHHRPQESRLWIGRFAQ